MKMGKPLFFGLNLLIELPIDVPHVNKKGSNRPATHPTPRGLDALQADGFGTHKIQLLVEIQDVIFKTCEIVPLLIVGRDSIASRNDQRQLGHGGWSRARSARVCGYEADVLSHGATASFADRLGFALERVLSHDFRQVLTYDRWRVRVPRKLAEHLGWGRKGRLCGSGMAFEIVNIFLSLVLWNQLGRMIFN